MLDAAIPLALILVAFFFSLLALLAAGTALVKTLAAERSTHRIIQVGGSADPYADPLAAPIPDVIEELDVPLAIQNQLDQDPEPPRSVEAYVRRQQALAAEDEYESDRNW